LRKALKIAFCILAIITPLLIGVSVAEVIRYGDMRDIYPSGLWVTATKLSTKPDVYVEIENDTYIAEAIATGNRTWVNQQESEFCRKTKSAANILWLDGYYDAILWLQDGNYYAISRAYVDYFYSRKSPSPIEVVSALGIAWAILIGLTVKFNGVSRWLRKKKLPISE